MNANEARQYLVAAVATETGRQALRALGLGAIIDAPTGGDDASAVIAARMLRKKLAQSYGF